MIQVKRLRRISMFSTILCDYQRTSRCKVLPRPFDESEGAGINKKVIGQVFFVQFKFPQVISATADQLLASHSSRMRTRRMIGAVDFSYGKVCNNFIGDNQVKATVRDIELCCILME